MFKPGNPGCPCCDDSSSSSSSSGSSSSSSSSLILGNPCDCNGFQWAFVVEINISIDEFTCIGGGPFSSFGGTCSPVGSPAAGGSANRIKWSNLQSLNGTYIIPLPMNETCTNFTTTEINTSLGSITGTIWFVFSVTGATLYECIRSFPVSIRVQLAGASGNANFVTTPFGPLVDRVNYLSFTGGPCEALTKEIEYFQLDAPCDTPPGSDARFLDAIQGYSKWSVQVVPIP